MSEVYLRNFRPVLPRHAAPQAELIEAMVRIHLEHAGDAENKAKIIRRFAIKESQIARRFLEITDHDPHLEKEIYRVHPGTNRGAPIEARMEFFNRRAKEVLTEMYPGEGPDHLIHVSCTGYCAPSAPQRLAAERGWRTEITHAYHMGCYAALPAIRLAAGQVIAFQKKVDIVHNEMCTLHMDPSTSSPEQIVVQSLFADGHIRYEMSSEPGPGFRLLGTIERLLPGTENAMLWAPASWGMKMALSREVPEKIEGCLRSVFMELAELSGVPLARACEGIFAIHPGGPKIIEAAQRALELKEDQVATSRQVLLERGNMSSATLPHIWHRLGHPSTGTVVCSFAFGPGLTVFGSLFEAA